MVEARFLELDEKFDNRIKLLEESSEEYYDSKDSDVKSKKRKKSLR